MGPPSNLYGGNQETIKIFLEDNTSRQARPLNALITDLREHHI